MSADRAIGDAHRPALDGGRHGVRRDPTDHVTLVDPVLSPGPGHADECFEDERHLADEGSDVVGAEPEAEPPFLIGQGRGG